MPKKTYTVQVDASITVTGFYLVEAESEDAANAIAVEKFFDDIDIKLTESMGIDWDINEDIHTYAEEES